MTVDFSEKPPQKIYTLAFTGNWMCFWMQEVSLKSDLYVSCLHAWQNMKNYSDKHIWMLHRPLITHYIKLQHCNIIIAIRDKLSIILSTFPRQSLTNKLTFDPFCLMRLCSPWISWKIITLHYIIDLCDRSHSYTLVLILTNSAMTTENLKNIPKHHRFFLSRPSQPSWGSKTINWKQT